MSQHLRFRHLAACCLAVLYSGSLAASACATTWISARSDHFILYSDSSEKIATAYVKRLEQYRYMLATFHGAAEQLEETPPLPIYFVSSFSQLRQTWPTANENVRGYFKNCRQDQGAVAINEGDMVMQAHSAQAQAENTSQAVLFHEYAHNFMFQTTTGPYPAWFVEGFAEYYSTTKLQDDQAVVGMAFSWRVRTLTSPGTWVKYEDILRNTWRPKHGDGDAETSAFYAQSWLLSHYLLADPDRRKKLSAYLQAYAHGDDPVTSFETIFGIPVKTLSKVLDSYMNTKLMATVFRVHDMPVAQVTVTTLPASASKLLLWDAADRLCPQHENIPALLDHIRTEAARFPTDDFAQSALARAEIIIGDEAKAIPYLKTYTVTHPDDADGFFMLGQA